MSGSGGWRVSIEPMSPLASAIVSVLTFGACWPTSGIWSWDGLSTLIAPVLAICLPPVEVTASTDQSPGLSNGTCAA